jgi:hypothetical protein
VIDKDREQRNAAPEINPVNALVSIQSRAQPRPLVSVVLSLIRLQEQIFQRMMVVSIQQGSG